MESYLDIKIDKGKENQYRRNYKDYLATMKAKKLIETFTLSVFMIE